MSRNELSRARASLAIASLALGLIGCATSGPSRSAKTVATMDETHERLTRLRGQIDKTQASLENLMRAGADNLKPSFGRYTKDVAELKSDGESTKARFKNMKSQKETYLAAWEKKPVHDAELQKIGRERRSELNASLDRVVDAVNTASDAFDPFLSDVVDIQRVLGSDLTAAGQALVARSAAVQRSGENGARATRSIDIALASLSEVAGQISPTGSMKK